MNTSALKSGHRWAPPIAMLGVPFDNVTTEQTVQLIEEMVASKRPHYLATANVDFVVQATHDVELHRILTDADLVLCDGMPLVWASRLLGNALPERVAGSDLVPLLLQVAEQKGYRVFFLGGQEDVAAKAVENIKAKHPALKIAGLLSPPFTPLLEMDHDALCKTIRDARTDLLFVSFGCPKQEKWIAMNYRRLGVPVCMGVGATIDFLAGNMKRAPRWMQRCGLEWIFRLLQEPRRLFKRYFTGLLVFGAGMIRQVIKLRQRKVSGATNLHVTATGVTRIIELPERFDAQSVTIHRQIWEDLTRSNKPLVVDGSHMQVADSTGIALLSRLQKNLRAAGMPMVLAAPSLALTQAVEVMQMHQMFDVTPTVEQGLKLLLERNAEQPVGEVMLNPDACSSLAWQGEVTAVNAQEVWQLTEVVLAATELRGGGSVNIDLSTVRFVDSSGVGLMVKAKKQGRVRGVSVAFTKPSDVARSVIRTLRMEAYLFGAEPALAA